jgi:hypothetical protein
MSRRTLSTPVFHGMAPRTVGTGLHLCFLIGLLFTSGCPQHFGSGKLQEAPVLEWPPPKATSFWTESGASVLEPGNGNLSTVAERLSNDLSQCGYEPRWYFIFDGERQGFAAITPIEQIDESGRPREGRDRWSLGPPDWGHTFIQYLRALVTPPPGHYRSFLIAVTPLPFNASATSIDRNALVGLYDAGTGDLSRFLRTNRFDERFALGVYVYEFESTSVSSPAALIGTQGRRLSAQEHLRASGLLSLLAGK